NGLAYFVEVALRHRKHPHWCACSYRGIPGAVSQDSHLTKECRRSQDGKYFGFAVRLAYDFTFAFLDCENAVANIPLIKDRLAWLKMLPVNSGYTGNTQLDEIRWKQKIHHPIDQNMGLGAHSRHFHQVDGSPEGPGKETGNMHAEDLSD